MNNIEHAFQIGMITEEEKNLIYEYNRRLSDNNVPIIYNFRHLRQLLQIKKSEQTKLFGIEKYKSYTTFKIPKKNGGVRLIEAPDERMKMVQYWIKENILDKFSVSKYAKGFVKGVSICHNALPHVRKEVIINIDLKDFFPSIKYEDVFKIFKYIGYTESVSKSLTNLCTNERSVLPQGAPTSPVLSNLVSLKLDARLSGLAKKICASYTRYADDITFSGSKHILKYQELIKEIINDEGYQINEEKYRVRCNFQHQEVTGLTVNSKISISKKLKKEIENAIYYCKKYGVIDHMNRINCERGFYKEHLYGIAYYIKMIDEEKGKSYIDQLNSIEWPV